MARMYSHRSVNKEDVLVSVERPVGDVTETISDQRTTDQSDTLSSATFIEKLTLAEYHKLFRSGCSRRVHQVDTIILSVSTHLSDTHIMVGAIEASKAPRMNLKATSPGYDLKEAMIMQDADHPAKQQMIQTLTLNLTRA